MKTEEMLRCHNTITQDGATHRHFHPGTYLNVMKKLPDSAWRIQVHMWDDGPEECGLRLPRILAIQRRAIITTFARSPKYQELT